MKVMDTTDKRGARSTSWVTVAAIGGRAVLDGAPPQVSKLGSYHSNQQNTALVNSTGSIADFFPARAKSTRQVYGCTFDFEMDIVTFIAAAALRAPIMRSEASSICNRSCEEIEGEDLGCRSRGSGDGVEIKS